MASIRIASIQKKPAGFCFGTTFEDQFFTDHSCCLLQNGVTFSVCLIFNLQIFGNLRHLQTTTTTLTSFPGVETTQTSGMPPEKKLHQNFQNGQPKKMSSKTITPQKKQTKNYIYICFLVKTSPKKSNSSRLIRCCNLRVEPGLHNPCWRS